MSESDKSSSFIHPHRGWYIMVTLLWPVYMTIAAINGMVEGLSEGLIEWRSDRALFRHKKKRAQ